jgi:hypothetical protein
MSDFFHLKQGCYISQPLPQFYYFIHFMFLPYESNFYIVVKSLVFKPVKMLIRAMFILFESIMNLNQNLSPNVTQKS